MMDYRLKVMIIISSLVYIFGCVCAENSDVYGSDFHFSNPTLFPPTETNVSLIRFYLWTRENQVEEDYDELFVDDNESLLNSHFDARRRTKILVHGYTSNGLTSFVKNAREAYLEKGDETIFEVPISLFETLTLYFPFRGLQCHISGLGAFG